MNKKVILPAILFSLLTSCSLLSVGKKKPLSKKREKQAMRVRIENSLAFLYEDDPEIQVSESPRSSETSQASHTEHSTFDYHTPRGKKRRKKRKYQAMTSKAASIFARRED